MIGGFSGQRAWLARLLFARRKPVASPPNSDDFVQSPVKVRAFLSYARIDAPAVDRLKGILEREGVEVSIDRIGIVPGEDWRERLGDLIRGSEVFIFAISPRSVTSNVCDWEINEAERLSKRILPIVIFDTSEAAIPGRLKRLQFLNLRTAAEMSANLGTLLTNVRVDVQWTREHTRLYERAALSDGRSPAQRRSGAAGGCRVSGRRRRCCDCSEARTWKRFRGRLGCDIAQSGARCGGCFD